MESGWLVEHHQRDVADHVFAPSSPKQNHDALYAIICVNHK